VTGSEAKIPPGPGRLITAKKYLSRPSPKFSSSSFLFSLHTYLVGISAIKKADDLSEHPALHSAEVDRYESPSGASPAQFLMDYLLLFIIWLIWYEHLRKSRNRHRHVEMRRAPFGLPSAGRNVQACRSGHAEDGLLLACPGINSPCCHRVPCPSIVVDLG
jgi:hypothetical protein